MTNFNTLCTTSLNWNCLLNSLGRPVGPVNNSILGKCLPLQIRTVVIISSLTLDGVLHAAEILVQRNNCCSTLSTVLGLLGLFGKSRTIVRCGSNVDCFRVGKSRILEGGFRHEVATFNGEGDGSRSPGLAVLFPHEGVVSLNEFPGERVRNGYHLRVLFDKGTCATSENNVWKFLDKLEHSSIIKRSTLPTLKINYRANHFRGKRMARYNSATAQKPYFTITARTNIDGDQYNVAEARGSEHHA